jgi:hypothetical protein
MIMMRTDPRGGVISYQKHKSGGINHVQTFFQFLLIFFMLFLGLGNFFLVDCFFINLPKQFRDGFGQLMMIGWNEKKGTKY